MGQKKRGVAQPAYDESIGKELLSDDVEVGSRLERDGERRDGMTAVRSGGTARAWPGVVAIVAAVLFGLLTGMVSAQKLLPFDLSGAKAIQGFNWGHLADVFQLINFCAGYYQVAVGLMGVVIVALLLRSKRAGWLMIAAAFSSVLDNVIKLFVQRARPSAEEVHILVVAGGYSYPSGHAVFMTWLSLMVAFMMAPHMNRRWRWVVWSLAAVIISLTMLARVWAGDHWPSDVLGGFLLGLGWSMGMVWLSERIFGVAAIEGGGRGNKCLAVP